MFRDLPALISEVDIIRHEITPKIILIDQNSMFMRRWDCVMLLCLVFVAIVTPFEVRRTCRMALFLVNCNSSANIINVNDIISILGKYFEHTKMN